MDLKEGKKQILIPHSQLIEGYLKIGEKHKGIMDFYFESLNKFDNLFIQVNQNFGKFINGKGYALSGRYPYILLQMKSALDSFFCHYFSLNSGICKSSSIVLRHCYETLLRNYLFLTLPEQDNVEMYQEIPQWMVEKKLYLPRTIRKHHRPLYKIFSNSAHAGIKSVYPSFMVSEGVFVDSLKTGLFLLYSYFVFIMDAFALFIPDEQQNKIRLFLNEFIKEFDSYPTLIPDKEEIKDSLKIINQSVFAEKLNADIFRSGEEYLRSLTPTELKE